MTPLLHEALVARGRTWGDRNAQLLAYMRDELRALMKRPKLRAAAMSRSFCGRHPIGGAGTDAFRRGGPVSANE